MALEAGNEELYLEDLTDDELPETPSPVALTKTGRQRKLMDRSSEAYLKKVANMGKANEARRQKALLKREAKAQSAEEVLRKQREAEEKARIMEETRQRIIEQELEKQAKKTARKIVKQNLAVDAAALSSAKDLERISAKVKTESGKKVALQAPVLAPPAKTSRIEKLPEVVTKTIVEPPLGLRPAPRLVPAPSVTSIPMTSRERLRSFGF